MIAKSKWFLTFLLLSSFLQASKADVVITEFMASNSRSLADEDGAFNDWIEVYNNGSAAVNLAGWSLTDTAGTPAKWVFPAVSLASHEHLLVWASNKNRRIVGSPLHTNFKLDGAGEYLALVRPDGSKSTEYAPTFPPQLADLSYGNSAAQSTTTVVAQGATGKVKVPLGPSEDATWMQPNFDDSSWSAAVNGIGFETGANEYGSGVAGNVLSQSPGGYWRLEETGLAGLYAGNAGSLGVLGLGAYSTGITQNVATLQSPTYPGFESDNVGARFAGAQKIDVAYSASLNSTSFSFSIWLKSTGGSSYRSAITSRNSAPTRGYILYVNGSTLEYWTGNGSGWNTTFGPTISNDTWYHVVGTYDSATQTKRLYVNGALYSTSTAVTVALNTANPLRIGAGATEGAGQFFWTGDLDEAAVFDRALTVTEIGNQYTNATTSTATTAPATILAQNPVGYWRLKDTNQTAMAANLGTAGAAGDGVYVGNAILGQSGPRPPTEAGFAADNKAPLLSGAGYVEAPFQSAYNPTTFTVECWAKPATTGGTYRSPVTSRDDLPQRGFIIYQTPSSTWEFWTGTGQQVGWNVLSGGAVTTGQWAHLVGTYDGTTKKFYVNGALISSAATAYGPNTARPLRIGAGATDGPANFQFNGSVDEVAVLPRPLTADEISTRYQLGKNNIAPPLNYTALIGTGLQASMFGVNSTAYFRLPFNMTTAVPDVQKVTLKMKYDDGFQAYLNGAQVASANVPIGLAWNSAATEANTTQDALQFESFNITAAATPVIQQGGNVLAIHGLNLAATNPDFLQLAQLEITTAAIYNSSAGYFLTSTPGQANGTGFTNPGPFLSDETSLPLAPDPTTDITITCVAKPVLGPINSVNLKWRTMFTALQSVTMLDDGLHGDGLAGDGIYGAVIPKTAFSAGQMVRWYFTADDTSARTSRWPLFTAPLASPEYFGTMISDPSLTSGLPIWYWFSENAAAATTRAGTRCSVFYNGEFYDNIYVRLRGGATSTGSKKFDFNTNGHCRIDDVVGRVEEANLNGTSLSSGYAGDSADATLIRPALAYEVFRTTGHPTSACFPVLMRLNGATDANSGRGGVAYFVEQVDERYLARQPLIKDGGILYKMDQRANLQPAFNDTTDGVQKKTRLTENNAELQQVVDGLHPPNNWNSAAPNTPPTWPTGFFATRRTFMFDQLNMANIANYLAVRAIINDTDDTRKNFYFYKDSEGSREWNVLPWDKDGTLGVPLDAAPYTAHPFLADYDHRKINSSHQWCYLWEAFFNDTKSRAMYLRRLRTLMDQILQPSAGYLEGRADALWAPVAQYKPAAGTNGMKAYFAQRRTDLFTTYSAPNSILTGVNIPTAQSANVVVNFGAVDTNPVSGNQAEEFIELVNPNAVDVDISGWQITGGVTHTFEPGTVILANDHLYVAGNSVAFRARATGPRGGQDLFVQGNFNGAISARGEALTLIDPVNPAITTDDRIVATLNTPATPTPAQQQLRVTEINYAPTIGDYAAGEYEFVELRNIGATPLNLTGCNFTDGITYTFGNLTLAAGDRVILVKNQTAFESRYGVGLPVVGPFTGSLDNAGERLRIVDAVGEEILDFTYDPLWQPSTNGLGNSLVIVDEDANFATWEQATAWTSSPDVHGSPGLADPTIPTLAKPDALSAQSTAGTVKILFKAIPGRPYLLESSNDMDTWDPLQTLTPDANGQAEYTDPQNSNRRFFRVRSP